MLHPKAFTMVEEQIVSRGINDQKVVDAMRAVPRHYFVNEKMWHIAYTDQPLPIGHNQTISQPYVVAYMTSALELKKNSRVLEIGTGSGYQAAVLAEIAKEVYSVEVIEELAEKARLVLKKLGYKNVKIKIGNGRKGWQEYAPYSHIIVTAASENIPKALIEQLDFGGNMIVPVGHSSWTQNLVLITKMRDSIRRKKILPVRFVPLVHDRKLKRRNK